MSEMFHRAVAFDGNISGWDVSEVTDMNRMFRFATVFNQSLNGWDVSSSHQHARHVRWCHRL